MKPLSIVIIGAGNLAYHLVSALEKQAAILQVFNHHRSKPASALALQARAPLVTDYKKLDANADVYLVCVKDEVIREVAEKLSTMNLKGTVLHTSGSTPMDVLKKASRSHGVFYPLQTFSIQDMVNWKETPVLVEGSNAKTAALAKKLAVLISGKVIACNSEERLKIHLAAVLSCNFSNALYALTVDFMKQEIPGKSFDLLKPLIRQTVAKLDKLDPISAQTGPAKRGDLETIKKHMTLLKAHPRAKAVYELMTKIIIHDQY